MPELWLLSVDAEPASDTNGLGVLLCPCAGRRRAKDWSAHEIGFRPIHMPMDKFQRAIQAASKLAEVGVKVQLGQNVLQGSSPKDFSFSDNTLCDPFAVTIPPDLLGQYIDFAVAFGISAQAGRSDWTRPSNGCARFDKSL